MYHPYMMKNEHPIAIASIVMDTHLCYKIIVTLSVRVAIEYIPDRAATPVTTTPQQHTRLQCWWAQTNQHWLADSWWCSLFTCSSCDGCRLTCFGAVTQHKTEQTPVAKCWYLEHRYLIRLHYQLMIQKLGLLLEAGQDQRLKVLIYIHPE